GLALLTPISSDVKLPPLLTPATIWSIDFSCAELLATLAPVVAAADPVGCGPADGIICLSPVTTVNQFFTAASGASCWLSCQLAPVAVGFHSGGKTPLPKNQVTYRRASGAPWANAVP